MLRYLIPSQVEECLNWWESRVKSKQVFQCLTCTDINGNKGPWGGIVDLGLYIILINETGLVLQYIIILFKARSFLVDFSSFLNCFFPSKVGVNRFCSKLMLGRNCLPEK